MYVLVLPQLGIFHFISILWLSYQWFFQITILSHHKKWDNFPKLSQVTLKTKWQTNVIDNHINSIWLCPLIHVIGDTMCQFCPVSYPHGLPSSWCSQAHIPPVGTAPTCPSLDPEIPLTRPLWAHNSNLVGILSAPNYDSNEPVRTQFCTGHDSSAVVTCAKLWSDCIIIFHVRATLILTRFEWWARKCLVTWVPEHMEANHTLWGCQITTILTTEMRDWYQGLFHYLFFFGYQMWCTVTEHAHRQW